MTSKNAISNLTLGLTLPLWFVLPLPRLSENENISDINNGSSEGLYRIFCHGIVELIAQLAFGGSVLVRVAKVLI